MLDVTDGLRGHNVVCANFFTSYELSQQLLKRMIAMVGTVRKNKPELPSVLLAIWGGMPSHQSLPSPPVVSYPPKRNTNVVLLSTLHKTAEISDRENRNHNKPQLQTAGGRAFSYRAPFLWNGLPTHVRDANLVSTFKSLLKTNLFSGSYD